MESSGVTQNGLVTVSDGVNVNNVAIAVSKESDCHLPTLRAPTGSTLYLCSWLVSPCHSPYLNLSPTNYPGTINPSSNVPAQTSQCNKGKVPAPGKHFCMHSSSYTLDKSHTSNSEEL